MVESSSVRVEYVPGDDSAVHLGGGAGTLLYIDLDCSLRLSLVNAGGDAGR